MVILYWGTHTLFRSNCNIRLRSQRDIRRDFRRRFSLFFHLIRNVPGLVYTYDHKEKTIVTYICIYSIKYITSVGEKAVIGVPQGFFRHHSKRTFLISTNKDKYLNKKTKSRIIRSSSSTKKKGQLYPCTVSIIYIAYIIY